MPVSGQLSSSTENHIGSDHRIALHRFAAECRDINITVFVALLWRKMSRMFVIVLNSANVSYVFLNHNVLHKCLVCLLVKSYSAP